MEKGLHFMFFDDIMADPIFSPDGKFMWTGSEWILAPSSTSQSANVNLHDSVIGGDVNITQNNAEDIATAMILALEQVGVTERSSSEDLTPFKTIELNHVTDCVEERRARFYGSMARNLVKAGTITLGAMGKNTEQLFDEAENLFEVALEGFRVASDLEGEADTLEHLAEIKLERGEVTEAERLYRRSLSINKRTERPQKEGYLLIALGRIEEKKGAPPEAERLFREALSFFPSGRTRTSILFNIGDIAKARNDLSEAERLFRECLILCKDLNFKHGEYRALLRLGIVLQKQGNCAEAERLIREALAICREHGWRKFEAYVLEKLAVLVQENGDQIEFSQ
jgi:tetratricopeptide (TPR) repeat protein